MSDSCAGSHSHRSFIVLLCAVLSVCFPARQAYCQSGMSFSVYTDSSQTSSTLYVYSTVADNSWGCSHGGYSTTANIVSPSNRQAHSTSGGLQASTSLAISNEFGNYNVYTTGSYTCSCIHGTAGYGGGGSTFVQKPTSLNNYYSGNLTGTPPGCSPPVRYWKVRDYQVMDQRVPAQPIARVMFMDESFTTPQNSCNVSFIQGDGNTTSSGTFRDNFYMCGSVPACSGSGSCTTVRNQTWKADSYQVGQYTITYTCTGVTVTP
jgi:hypothetical protein